jgi:hypothetical protein
MGNRRHPFRQKDWGIKAHTKVCLLRSVNLISNVSKIHFTVIAFYVCRSSHLFLYFYVLSLYGKKVVTNIIKLNLIHHFYKVEFNLYGLNPLVFRVVYYQNYAFYGIYFTNYQLLFWDIRRWFVLKLWNVIYFQIIWSCSYRYFAENEIYYVNKTRLGEQLASLLYRKQKIIKIKLYNFIGTIL